MGRGSSVRNTLAFKVLPSTPPIYQIPLEVRQLHLLLALQTYTERPVSNTGRTIPALMYLLHERGFPTSYTFHLNQGSVFNLRLWTDWLPLNIYGVLEDVIDVRYQHRGLRINNPKLSNWLTEQNPRHVQMGELARLAYNEGVLIRDFTESESDLDDLARVHMAQQLVSNKYDHEEVSAYLNALGYHLGLSAYDVAELDARLIKLGLSATP